MHHFHRRPSPTGLTPFDALAALLITIALILIVAGMLGCSWHVAIDTWEGTASSELDVTLTPAKATNNRNPPQPPRPAAPAKPTAPTTAPTPPS
jgi:hypothetical protein